MLEKRQIERLLELYRTKRQGVELEARFAEVTDTMWNDMYTRALSTLKPLPRLEMTASIINPLPGRITESRTIEFTWAKNVLMRKESQRRKSSLGPPAKIAIPPIAVHVSHEEPISGFVAAQDAQMRFKLRASFALDDWRLDFTAVNQAPQSMLAASAQMIRDKLFREELTYENLIAKLERSAVSRYEIELEYIGQKLEPASFATITKVVEMVDPGAHDASGYAQCLRDIGRMIAPHIGRIKGLKSITNQVVSLGKSRYMSDIFPPIGYYLTDKADGVRAIVRIENNICTVLRSDGMQRVERSVGASNAKDPSTIGSMNGAAGGSQAPTGTILVDTEMITSADGKSTTLWIFDCMYDGSSLLEASFAERWEHAERARDIVRQYIPCEIKSYIHIAQESQLEEYFNRAWKSPPYPVDGLILVEPDRGYHETRNYKWKPVEKCTIDFLAIKCPKTLLGKLPYKCIDGKTLYLLHVGIRPKLAQKLGIRPLREVDNGAIGAPDYQPVQFTPSINPLAYLYYDASPDLDHKIIELGADPEVPCDDVTDCVWKFHRVREDRAKETGYFGNDYRVAEITYSNLVDRFQLADLWTRTASYFTKTAGNAYVAPNKYKRFVFSMLLREYLANADIVIDAACGRGGDLHRFQEIGVKTLIGIDIDKSAITELIERKYAYAEKKLASTMQVHVAAADLRTPGALLDSIERFGHMAERCQGVTINFALHYFCGSDADIASFLCGCKAALRVGGYMIATIMSGERVHQLLSHTPYNQRWEYSENGVIKYALRRLYRGDKLQSSGQMIGVVLPFADTEYQEPLCNIAYVVRVAKKLGFGVIRCDSMQEMDNDFQRAAPALHGRLTVGDREYIALHDMLVLRREK